MDLKSLIIPKLDIDGNGKLDYHDVIAKLGMSFVRGFICGSGFVGVVAVALWRAAR